VSCFAEDSHSTALMWLSVVAQQALAPAPLQAHPAATIATATHDHGHNHTHSTALMWLSVVVCASGVWGFCYRGLFPPLGGYRGTPPLRGSPRRAPRGIYHP